MTQRDVPREVVLLKFEAFEVNSVVANYSCTIELEGQEVLYNGGDNLSIDTDNGRTIAGYIALISGLEVLIQWQWETAYIVAKTHSRLIVNHMRGYWDVLPAPYAPFAKEAQELATRFTKLRYWWIDDRAQSYTAHQQGGQHHE